VTPGNLELYQVVTEMLVVPGTLAAIVRLDERRLSDERLARAWPPVSRDAVVFATWQFGILFGCPSLLVWFIRTRGALLGVPLGLAAALGLFLAALASAYVPEVAIDWLGL
jgi:hypothetical protein